MYQHAACSTGFFWLCEAATLEELKREVERPLMLTRATGATMGPPFSKARREEDAAEAKAEEEVKSGESC